LPIDGDVTSAQPARRRAQVPLRARHAERKRGGSERGNTESSGLGVVGGQNRERAPGANVVSLWSASAEQLEVVANGEHHADQAS
jgi:hypothetical protein